MSHSYIVRSELSCTIHSRDSDIYRSWRYIVYAKVAIRRICNFSWIYVTITTKSLRYLPFDEDGNTNIQFKYICSTIKLKWARFQHIVLYIVKLVKEKILHLRHTLKFIAGYQITCTVQHNMRSNQKLQMATKNLWSSATLLSFIFFVSHFIFSFSILSCEYFVAPDTWITMYRK